MDFCVRIEHGNYRASNFLGYVFRCDEHATMHAAASHNMQEHTYSSYIASYKIENAREWISVRNWRDVCTYSLGGVCKYVCKCMIKSNNSDAIRTQNLCQNIRTEKSQSLTCSLVDFRSDAFPSRTHSREYFAIIKMALRICTDTHRQPNSPDDTNRATPHTQQKKKT